MTAYDDQDLFSLFRSLLPCPCCRDRRTRPVLVAAATAQGAQGFAFECVSLDCAPPGPGLQRQRGPVRETVEEAARAWGLAAVDTLGAEAAADTAEGGAS